MSEMCTVCERELEDGRPVQRDLDGQAAHCECLETQELDDEGDGEQ